MGETNVVKTSLAPLAGAVLGAMSIFAPAAFGADVALPRKAPELAFTIPSQGQKLLSQYRGKVVALEFIFTTCPHCQAASKMMTKLQAEYGPKGFQAIDIAVNENADLLVDNFVKDYQVGFPVGHTPQSQMVSFMGFPNNYFVVPQLVIIDRKGMIQHQTPPRENEEWDKLMKEENIRQNIEQLLGVGTSSTSSKRTSSTPAKVAQSKRPS